MGSNNIGIRIEDSIAAAHVILSISETKNYFCRPWGKTFCPDLWEVMNDRVVISGCQVQDLMRKASTAAYDFGNGNTGVAVMGSLRDTELFFVEDKSGKPTMDLLLFLQEQAKISGRECSRYKYRAEWQQDIFRFHMHVSDFLKTLSKTGQNAPDGGHHFLQIFEMTPLTLDGRPLPDTTVKGGVKLDH